MKKLTLILLLITTGLFAQEVPKGADKIVIKNNKTASENFLMVKQTLADKGTEIASQDKDIYQIKTGKIKYNSYANYILLVNCKDNQIALNGTWTNDIGLNVGGITIAPSDYKIEYKGSSKAVFEKMDAFAKQLGTTINYEGGTVTKESKSKKDDVY